MIMQRQEWGGISIFRGIGSKSWRTSRICAVATIVFAIVVDVITKNARWGVVNKLLNADDLAFMSKDMEDLKERF